MEASLYGVLQLLIPETENDGAKKGGEDCVGGGQQSVTVHSGRALRFCLHHLPQTQGPLHPKVKYLGINLTKAVKDLYTESNKIDERKCRQNKWKYSMLIV